MILHLDLEAMATDRGREFAKMDKLEVLQMVGDTVERWERRRRLMEYEERRPRRGPKRGRPVIPAMPVGLTWDEGKGQNDG